MFCQLLDWVPSVFQYTLISIDVTDARSIADGVQVSRVVDSDGFLVLILQFADILGVNIVTVFAFLHRDSGCFACALVSESQSVFLSLCDVFRTKVLSNVGKSPHILSLEGQ